MRVIIASWAIPLSIATTVAGRTPSFAAYFEPPRSIGTPFEDLARNYTGQGLADRIAGRFRLDTDRSLTEAARQLIRRRIALR